MEPNSPWQAYPVIKVGDWGLASLTNVHDAENPEKFVKNGTAWYLPPVSDTSEPLFQDDYGMEANLSNGGSVPWPDLET